MKKAFIYVTLFCVLFFILVFTFSFYQYKQTKDYYTAHENLLFFEQQLSNLRLSIERKVDSVIIQKQLKDKTPLEINFIEEQKKIDDIIYALQKKLVKYVCISCHTESDYKIKRMQEDLQIIKVKSDNLVTSVSRYLYDSSLVDELLDAKKDFEINYLNTQKRLKNMEDNYNSFILKKTTLFSSSYLVFSFFNLLLIVAISTFLYRNFMRDFFRLTKLCTDYQKKGVLTNLEPLKYITKEMQILAETILNTINQVSNNEIEIEQQLEEIKGMNEELQSSNQQLEILTAELEETKRELEVAVNQKTKQLEKAYEELQNLDKMKSDFLQSISHEFKTPLTPLLGYLKLFKNKELGELNLLQEQSIDIMLTCAEKLYNTIDDLIFLARLNIEKERYMLKDIDITYLLKNTVGRVTRELEEKKLSLSLNTPEFTLLIKGEQLMLTQAILHLLRNAIKYTPEKGKISVSLYQSDNNVVLSIVDSGVGMPEKTLNEINEYFSSTDIYVSRKGNFVTLGINILKQVVAFHNAKVYYKSEKGKGTLVELIFPLKT